MTDTMHAQRARLTGLSCWLERGGRVWKIPLAADAWFIGPPDDLFLGDKITFPRDLPGRNLLLRVTFEQGRVFAGGFRQHSYELPAVVACPECEGSGVPAVTVADLGGTPGPVWTFLRTCDCGARWQQDG